MAENIDANFGKHVDQNAVLDRANHHHSSSSRLCKRVRAFDMHLYLE